MKGLVPTVELEQIKDQYSYNVIELRVPRLDEQRHLLLLQRIQ
jgi:16S rRNA (guanine527-N7)-methyltransferase